MATHLGATLYAVLPCAAPPSYGEDDIVALLSRQGADKVILLSHPDLSPPTLFQHQGEALLEAATRFSPALLLLPEGPAAVELAPRVAARLGALYARHPNLLIGENGALRIDQVMFDDSYLLRLDSDSLENSLVAVVAVDPQQVSRHVGVDEAEVVVLDPGLPSAGSSAQDLQRQEGSELAACPRRVLLAGPEVDSRDDLELLRQLADRMGAALRLTEEAAAKGLPGAPRLEPRSLTCTPELLLAFGVRGSANTLGLISDSTYVIAVGLDRDAPIFERAQLGLVASPPEAARQMLTELESHPASAPLPLPPVRSAPPRGQSDRDDEPGGPGAKSPPGAEPEEDENLRAHAPTEEMAPLDAPDSSEHSEAGAEDPALAATIRPIDQLAHTPPMGTPLPLEMQRAREAAAGSDAPGADALHPHTRGDAASTASGVVGEAQDPALDDTLPATLPETPDPGPTPESGDEGGAKP